MLSMVQDVAAAAADNALVKIVMWIIPKTHDRQWLKWLKSRENSINIPPTMYKNRGDIITIMVGKTLIFLISMS